MQQAVAAFNQGTRKKTLVEQHQERLQKKQVWFFFYGRRTVIVVFFVVFVFVVLCCSNHTCFVHARQHIQCNTCQHLQGKQKAAAVKQAKGATQASKEAGPTGGVEWEGKHPWRPFDRDRDLQQAPKNSAHDVIKKAGNLSSRFSSSGGP